MSWWYSRRWLAPGAARLWLLRCYARLFHHITVTGLEHYPPAHEHALIVPNHLSLADGPLLAAFLPGSPVFVIDTFIAERWWARPFLTRMRLIRVDTRNPFSVRTIIEQVKDGQRLVLFPEGRISETGGLMKVYDGAGMVADKAQAKLVPVRIEGTQFTHLSYLKGKLRRRWFPRISITILPPVSLSLDPALFGRPRRHAAARLVRDVMVDAAFATQPIDRTLFAALLAAGKRHGWRMKVLRDADNETIDYRRILVGAGTLGRALAALTTAGEHVGVLLPNASGALIAVMALQAFARVPAMLNITAGAAGMVTACRTARVRYVVSSHRLTQQPRLRNELERMAHDVAFIWLEDLVASLGVYQRLRGWAESWLAHRLPGCHVAADTAAMVMFTSGTEGVPKGVVLSHRAILANCAQAAAVIDFTSADRVFNALPMFHAFGLTVGTLVPVLGGVPTFLYPTPLHYRLVPELIYGHDATIVFGTDTFLNGWAHYADPYDFRAVRYMFAGAERLKESTRRLYAERFGVRVLEGYGATETAPVLSINTPTRNAPGSAGRFMPGISWKLEDVAAPGGAGRLWVRGPNVMLGYLRATAPGVLEPLHDGWYDTGDIVQVDELGFVWIRDRAARFAKIGGEMVAMSVGEVLADAAWPGAANAVVALPDPAKGERLILVTSNMHANVATLLDTARAHGVAEIMVPRTVICVERLPRLGTGKIDYPAVRQLAATQLVAA